MKATRPLEYLCFSAFPLPAKLDSGMWAFIAIDIYKKQEFLLDICPKNDKETLLLNIEMFLEDADFLKNKKGTFTLIFTEENSKFKADIKNVLDGSGGTCEFDSNVVKKEIDRVLSDINAAFYRA